MLDFLGLLFGISINTFFGCITALREILIKNLAASLYTAYYLGYCVPCAFGV